MTEPVRVLHYGLGPIGVRIARLAATRPNLLPIAAVDIDPAKVQQDLGQVAELPETLGVLVQPTLHAALQTAEPHVALHATGSRLPSVLQQFLDLAKAGLPAVSTCEELSYPWFHHPEEAHAIDQAAKRNGIAILATGINPGFIMDLLPVVLSGVCPQVSAVRVRRVVDLSLRRSQLQKKVGVGMTPAQFETARAAGSLGHVGLPESIALIAGGLGWSLDRVEQQLEPVIAPERLRSELGTVEAGQVQGQHQVGRGIVSGHERITLTLTMALQAPDAGDYAELDGPEPVSSVIHGVQGDIATAAIIVNAVPLVLSAAPGLYTVLDMPPMRSVSV